jgi:hypothetical protein
MTWYVPSATAAAIRSYSSCPQSKTGCNRRPEEELGLAVGIEESQRCASYQLPSAGTLHGVDACLLAGDAHRAGGDLQPGRLLARGGNAFVHPPEVTEAGGEAKHVNEAVGGGVDGDHIAGGEAVMFGNMMQVGTRLAAVEDRDVDDLGAGRRMAAGSAAQARRVSSRRR